VLDWVFRPDFLAWKEAAGFCGMAGDCRGGIPEHIGVEGNGSSLRGMRTKNRPQRDFVVLRPVKFLNAVRQRSAHAGTLPEPAG
jgi:hypothetical protein